MPISHPELQRLADLARIPLDEAELPELQLQLSTLLAHLAVLAGDAPGEFPDEPSDPSTLRPDEIGFDPLSIPLADVAPDWREGLLVVPRPPALGPAPDS